MTQSEWVSLYFERSNALQSYWTLYVKVIGGLLAVASLRKEPDVVAAVLATVLYCCFAYKTLDAIHDVSQTRLAVLSQIQFNESSGQRSSFVSTLQPPAYEDVRNFHIGCDGLTIVTLWALQYRRWRRGSSENETG